jgi:glycosyltransferase involved in cell wall biosynthesis
MLLCNDELVRAKSEERGVSAELCPIGGDVALFHAWRVKHALSRLGADAFIVGTYKKLFLASLGAHLARVPRIVARVGLETDTPRSRKYRFALRRWIDGVAVNSERMVESFASLDGFGREKVTLIHNGVLPPGRADPDRSLRAELGIPLTAFVVGAVARLAKQKRLDRLIEAVALADGEVHCIVAGDGEERERLRDLATSRHLGQRIHFIGQRENPAHVLGAMDAFIITSDREGLSNAMLEAMAHGLPVISTSVSGAADALGGDNPAGIITGFAAADIAAAIERLRTDRVARDGMGREARERAMTRFSFDTMLDRWEAFLAA